MSHKQLTEYETEEDSLLFTIPSTYTSPLILVSTALSAIALVFTVIVSIRLKALSLLFLNAKIASALPTTLDYYRTTPNIFLLSYRTTPVNVMESLSVTSILQITSICLLAALLVVLAYYYLFHKYMKAKDLRKPYCKIYLQLEFPSTHIYTYFMTLNSHISCYLFSARENLKSVAVEGSLFPCLRIEWPTLNIINVMGDNDEVKLPQCIKLTYSQAHILRKAIAGTTKTPVPIFYTHRSGHIEPSVVHFHDAAVTSIPKIEEMALEPTAPSNGITTERENKRSQNITNRLYPVM